MCFSLGCTQCSELAMQTAIFSSVYYDTKHCRIINLYLYLHYPFIHLSIFLYLHLYFSISSPIPSFPSYLLSFPSTFTPLSFSSLRTSNNKDHKQNAANNNARNGPWTKVTCVVLASTRAA